jgi:zinc transporter ZupT
MTSIGAGVGYWLGGSVGHEVVVIIEGLAAGAMLTMIAAAMIPEAIHLGGSSVTGFGTLTGFLSAIAFKLLE